MNKAFNKTTLDVLYRINCNSVKIAKEIEPKYRATITHGIPLIYTFKAIVGHRAPEALELRKRVARILRDKRKAGLR